jgi:hypothetical protein
VLRARRSQLRCGGSSGFVSVKFLDLNQKFLKSGRILVLGFLNNLLAFL